MAIFSDRGYHDTLLGSKRHQNTLLGSKRIRNEFIGLLFQNEAKTILLTAGDHEGGPDGMDFDAEGNLLVANWGSGHLEVFGPDGGYPKQRIRCPFRCPSNLHFRPGSEQVLVTEHENHALWQFQWKCPGRKEYCEL